MSILSDYVEGLGRAVDNMAMTRNDAVMDLLNACNGLAPRVAANLIDNWHDALAIEERTFGSTHPEAPTENQ